MTRHLLVTNDYPPKVGGIQSYLWELWRRLDPSDVCVYTTPHSGAALFDAQQAYRVERSPEPWLGPFPHLIKRINALALEHEAELIIVDPAVPLGVIAQRFELPYAVVLHGAEVTVPARLPGTRQTLKRVLDNAEFVISAGEYALAEAERCVGRPLKSVVVPPGVDTERFIPFGGEPRSAARQRFGIADSEIVVATVNRLVPRKGMDLLVSAVAEVQKFVPQLRLIIGGTGREEDRLRSQIERLAAPAKLLGRISDADVVDLYGAADFMAMLCTSRWGGLEQEGFGIVFLEAAAAGLPQIAGRSGGAAEAVLHNQTGLVVDAQNPKEVTSAIMELAADRGLRRKLGDAARVRAESHFEYDLLARRLDEGIEHFAAAFGE